MELEQILLAHRKRYPQMQPSDAVKLIYQNEFGGGHLIRDEEACLRYLRQEYAQVKKTENTPLYEDIGNGMIRVHLGALPEEELEQLGKVFIRSAAAHTGNLDNFLKKLEILKVLTAKGVFSFCQADLETYLGTYAEAGYPMVSHSGRYRECYSPSYRIVCSAFYLPQET